MIVPTFVAEPLESAVVPPYSCPVGFVLSSVIVLTSETFPALNTGDVIYIGNIKKAVEDGVSDITGVIIRRDKTTEKLALKLPPLTAEERKIILSGCLINSCGSR